MYKKHTSVYINVRTKNIIIEKTRREGHFTLTHLEKHYVLLCSFDFFQHFFYFTSSNMYRVVNNVQRLNEYRFNKINL